MIFIYTIENEDIREEVVDNLCGEVPMIMDDQLNLVTTESLVEELEELKETLTNLVYKEKFLTIN